MYLSFGPGWYVIPYLVFNSFNIPFTPLALQILNLCFLLASLFLLYRFIYYLCAKMGYDPILPGMGACFVFLFSPSILWYLGNGYVCTGIVLPFLITILHYGVKMLYDPDKIGGRSLLVFFLAAICSIYIDWYGISFLAVICLALLLRIRQNKKYWLFILISSLAIACGTLLILLQFVSYTGWQPVNDYLTSRYHDRSFSNPDINKVWYVTKILFHLVTGFLPVLITLVLAVVIIRKSTIRYTFTGPIQTAVILSLSACLLHSLLLLNWSGDHDFSVIPFSISLSVLSAWAVHNIVHAKHRLLLAILLFFSALAQYYYINFPGPNTMQGLPYSSFQQTGKLIARLAASDEKIFCSEDYRIYQYYAKRSFTYASSYEKALQIANRYHVRKWVWIKIRETPDTIFIEEVRRSR